MVREPAGCDVVLHPFGDGVLNVQKPAGWTSHDVVARVRKSLAERKVGHAGTLDPAATGVLPVLVGRGTRIAEYLMAWEKEYRAVLRLGETTDTLDATGVVQERFPLYGLTETHIRHVIGTFIGTIRQTPPMYSAVKVNGMPLYKMAREGRTVDRASREVMIREVEVLSIDGADVTFRIVCSKGTYIRSLCADIGAALRVGGHLRALERTRVGPLSVERSVTMEELEARSRIGLPESCWLSLDAALGALPACRVSIESAGKVLHGMPLDGDSILQWEQPPQFDPYDGRPLRIKDEQGRLLAVGILERIRHGPESGSQGSPRLSIKKVFVSNHVTTCVS